jgi:hypothetical protein
MDFLEDIRAGTERLNAGAQVVEVPPVLIERMWEALSRIHSDKRQHAASYVGALLDPGLVPSNPEQRLATMVRYALLNALLEADVLDEYMKDEKLRKKVFTAAASLPCDKNDLGEAAMEKVLRDSPPDIRQKKKEELIQAGYDPDHLKVADRFIAWMNDRVDR